MKEQVPLTAAELKEAFEAAFKAGRASLGEDGSGVILGHLSDTVRALQDAGAAIGVTVRAGSHSNAYDMMYTTSDATGGTIDAYGFIKCGEAVKLFAVASVLGETAVARLYLSKYNVAEEGARVILAGNTSRTAIPGECFDFNEDAEALQKLQKRLAEVSANNAAVLDCDSGRVFNRDPSRGEIMQKPSGRLKL